MIKELAKNSAENLFLLYNQNIEHFWTKSQIEDSFNEEQYAHFGVVENNNIICAISVLCLPDCIEVLAIATEKNRRNNGYAKKLVEFCLQKFNKDCFLEVRESNISAIKFYKNCGFLQISIRKNYYQNNDGSCENALILKCENNK